MNGDDPRRVDAINSALVLFLLAAGMVAFVAGAAQQGIAGLPEVVAGGCLWAIAWHLKNLGRLY
jgi:hypothetical protein